MICVMAINNIQRDYSGTLKVLTGTLVSDKYLIASIKHLIIMIFFHGLPRYLTLASH